jgi:signal transduction histidine kinase
VVALLAAVAVLLTARQLAHLKAERDARAAVADAVAPVADALRTVKTSTTAATAQGARQVAITAASSAGVSGATATRARDSGVPELEDSAHGVVVVATYDTPTPPGSVAGRRTHVTGLRVAPMRLAQTLEGLRPARGGLSFAGPDRTVESAPERQPPDRVGYTVTMAPGLAQDWQLTAWTSPRPIPAGAWLLALLVLLAGVAAAALAARRSQHTRRREQELQRLQQTSATTATLSTVAQHSLDLADLLPAFTAEFAEAWDLHGMSLGAPTAEGERQFFAWGAAPALVPAATTLPHQVRSGESLCLVLGRGGRTVARLRVVAGRDLDRDEVEALGTAAEVLTSALANAETFAQQRALLQRLRSVDELKTVFLATASHELRTPVGAIIGYAQILATSWDSLSSEEARMYAERVDSSAKRLGSLVEDLLDFSRLERGVGVSGSDVPLDLGETVAQILEEQPDLGADHAVQSQTAPGLVVTGSFEAVERVVSNLVGNATKYSPAGSAIRVSVRARRGRAELIVDDEGPGVPPAEREQVFSRFFRGRGDSVVATRGAGLGLAIVSEFAATMGGQVSVTSADSGGARFVVSYPLATTSDSSVEGAADVHS